VSDACRAPGYAAQMQFLVVLVVAALWVKYFWVFVVLVAGTYIVHRLAKEIR
jgi:hypothetical protein